MSHITGNQGFPTAVFVVLLLTIGALAVAVPLASAQNLPGDVYSVTGTVWSAHDESTIGQATIVLTPAEGGQPTTASSASDGTYQFESLPAGTYNLSANHKCCATGFQQATLGGSTLETSGVDFVLFPQEHPTGSSPIRIAGKVFDATSNEAVANAHIMISNYFDAESSSDGQSSAGSSGSSPEYYPRGYQYFEVVSGADGFYGVEVNAGQVEFNIDHSDFDYARGSFFFEDNATLNIPMQAAQGARATLHGILRDDSGAIVTGGWVNVGPDYRCSGDVCAVESEPARAPSSKDGFYYESRSGRWAGTEVGRDGSWSLDVQPGRLQITASSHDWNRYAEAQKLLTVEAGEDRQVDMVLERIPADSVRISGLVIDAVSGDPVPYASISIEEQHWGRGNWTQTEKDGRFEVWTKPGYVILTVSAYEYFSAPCEYRGEPEPATAGGSSGSSQSAPVMMPADCSSGQREHQYYTLVRTFSTSDGEARDFDFKLARAPAPTSVFEGWVINASSQKGIPGAYVSFFNEATRDWGQAVTDKDGSFRIKVHPGYYTIRVNADGYYALAVNDQLGDKETKRIALTLEPGQSRYGGCCYYGGGRVVAEDSSASGGSPTMGAAAPGPGADGSASPQAPDGQQRYLGEEGALGPYSPNADGPKPIGGEATPAPPMALVLLALLVGSEIARRRR